MPLLLMLLPLAACATAPFNLDKTSLALIAPDVPVIDAKVQRQAADEMAKGQCKAENKIINACLLTRDDSRLIK
jgi:hypothetical protein